MYIGDWIGRSSQLHGQRIAVVDLDKGEAGRFTYADLDERARRLASWLQQAGVTRGARVALLAQNGVEYLDAFFACGKLGLIFVPLNYRLHTRELVELCADLAPQVLIQGSEYGEQASAIAAALPSLRRLHLGPDAQPASTAYAQALATSSAALLTCEELREEDIACLLFTGGTTGQPKGAMISHRMIAWNILTTLIHELNRDDVTITHTPMFHTGGLLVYTIPLLAVGGKVVLMRRWEPDRMLSLLAAEAVTFFFAVPTQFQQLLAAPGFAASDFSSVRFVTSGGAPLPVPLLAEFQRTHPTPFKQGFGMTECGPGVFSMGPEFAVTKAGSIGRPNFFVDAKVVDDAGQPVASGETGELLLRTPALFSGYFGRPDESAKAVDGAGWLHTGDLCRVDSDGFFYIVDRKKDMFISGGENVYPVEIERVLYQHPAIFQCAVVSVADPQWGQVGRAFIVLKEGAAVSEEALLAFLRQHLARYKIPKSIMFRAALPLTPAGKIQKRELV